MAQVNAAGVIQFTNNNAYSGNNGRAAILAADGNYYMVGNTENGNDDGNIASLTGVQRIAPGSTNPNSAEIGQFSVTQAGLPADKTAKDNNFRGETIANKTLSSARAAGAMASTPLIGPLPSGTKDVKQIARLRHIHMSDGP